MISISSIIRAFGAGAVGGAANVLLLVIIWTIMEQGPGYSHEFLYRQMTWGGIWGFAFLIPIMTNNWILRGIVWGAIATVVALFVFKVVPVSVPSVIIGLVVNSGAWGLTASWLYRQSAPAGTASASPES